MGENFGIITKFNVLERIFNNWEFVMLELFKQFLLHRGSIKPQYVLFHLKWVTECYNSLNINLATRIHGDQKREFLAQMAKRHEDWQVKQADTSLRLYDYFLSREIKAKPEGEPAFKGDWRALEEKMREALRLRQRSYSTEKTYLTRLRGFRAFVQEKEPLRLEGRDLQDFLSHLAVEKKVSPITPNQAFNAVVFIFWRMDMTSGRSKSCWATRTSRPP